MAEIILNNGCVALVDEEDYDRINKFRWNYYRGYAIRGVVKMHRVVMGVTDPKIQVDHINHNRLDNRKENLRLVDNAENRRNLHNKGAGQTSRFFGVCRNGKNFSATITSREDVTLWLGTYATEEEAAVAYNLKAEELGILTRNDVDMSIIPNKLVRSESLTGILRSTTVLEFSHLLGPNGEVVTRDFLIEGKNMYQFCLVNTLNKHKLIDNIRYKRSRCKDWKIIYGR